MSITDAVAFLVLLGVAHAVFMCAFMHTQYGELRPWRWKAARDQERCECAACMTRNH